MSIIGNPIMAGASGPAASIFVTGLSENDTVTATNGSKTKVGVWTQIPNPAAYGLPDGYTELEYIRSSGNQYIDLGVSYGADVEVQLDFTLTEVSNNTRFFGSYPAYDNKRFLIGYNGGALTMWSAANVIASSLSASTPYTLVAKSFSSKCSLNVNGSVYSSTPDSPMEISSLSWIIFAGKETDGIGKYSKMTLRSCVIRDGDSIKLHEYIPAKRNSDSAIGLYDLVTNAFFENAGTGAFTAGPEIPQTVNGFLIKPIRDLGTWTVTATDGTNTTTQDVLVDVITDYEIEMSLSA